MCSLILVSPRLHSNMAVLDLARSVSLLYVIPAALITFIVYIVIQSKRARLDDIPGPWLARYTDAWRAYEAWKSPGSDTNYQIRVFKLYGDVVRIGPTTVLVSDPEAINTVLGFKTRLEKVRLLLLCLTHSRAQERPYRANLGHASPRAPVIKPLF